MKTTIKSSKQLYFTIFSIIRGVQCFFRWDADKAYNA